jgi:hypothetical protein
MSKEAIQQLREVHAIQGRKGCYDIDDYMLGLYNGLELALSLMEQRDVKYKERETLAKQEQKRPQNCGTSYCSCIECVMEQEQGEPWLLESTQELAKAMAKKFYPEVTQFEVLDSLAGVISQIDNMTTGLIRKPKQEQGEPVADINVRPHVNGGTIATVFSHSLPVGSWLLYTTPQQRKPLTDEMIHQCPYSEQNESCKKAFYYGWIKAEAAHGIKE